MKQCQLTLNSGGGGRAPIFDITSKAVQLSNTDRANITEVGKLDWIKLTQGTYIIYEKLDGTVTEGGYIISMFAFGNSPTFELANEYPYRGDRKESRKWKAPFIRIKRVWKKTQMAHAPLLLQQQQIHMQSESGRNGDLLIRRIAEMEVRFIELTNRVDRLERTNYELRNGMM